jgi:hypothetical protein
MQPCSHAHRHACMAIMQSHACIQQQGLGTLPWWRIVEAFQLCKALPLVSAGVQCTVVYRYHGT